MKQHDNAVDRQRRRLLGGAAAAGIGGALASTLPAAVAAQPAAEPQRPKGYRLTRHVIDYYKSIAK